MNPTTCTVNQTDIAHLYQLIPTRTNNYRILGIRAESYARNPVGVSLLGDGELAIAESVPELDRSVAGSRYNLSVVGREGDRQNIVGVSNKSASCSTCGKLPEAKSLVP